MNLNGYQNRAYVTAVFPQEAALSYLPLKLAGEAGEVAEKFGKLFRKHGHADYAAVYGSEINLDLAKELGDVLWYVAILASKMGWSLNAIAELNLEKLRDRKERGVIDGSGDNR